MSVTDETAPPPDAEDLSDEEMFVFQGSLQNDEALSTDDIWRLLNEVKRRRHQRMSRTEMGLPEDLHPECLDDIQLSLTMSLNSFEFHEHFLGPSQIEMFIGLCNELRRRRAVTLTPEDIETLEWGLSSLRLEAEQASDPDFCTEANGHIINLERVIELLRDLVPR